MEPKISWNRTDVSFCYCEDNHPDDIVPQPHIHCPCVNCEYSAVSIRTEYRHWEQFQTVFEEQSDEDMQTASSNDNDNSQERDNDMTEEEVMMNDDDNVDNNDDVQNAEDNGNVQNAGNRREEMAEVLKQHILETFDLAQKLNASEKNTEEMFTLIGRVISSIDGNFRDLWPSSLSKGNELLQELGYTEPQAKGICFNANHPLHWYETDIKEACPECEVVPSIRRQYLPISQKILLWTSTKKKCSDMLGHWRAKDRWLNKLDSPLELNEIWDGSRFRELSWFWDPDSIWTLPHKCLRCWTYMKILHSAETLVEVTCLNCGLKDTITPIKVSGNPRNIGLIGHWDGWQPFGKSGTHSSGAIEISIANLPKALRNKKDEAYVTSFVPEVLLPNQQPNSLDPFLEPMIQELEELFVNGIDVDYPLDFDENVTSGKTTIRCILLLWTGDYPAQCEIGKFSSKGTFGCRIDKCKGMSVNGSSTKYYVGNREHARFPWDERVFHEERTIMDEIEHLPSIASKKKRAKETGYTGLTLLSRLNTLYEFDPCKDMVRDVMHLVPMNCGKKIISRLIHEKILDVKVVDEKLKEFPFTKELLDGRCPKDIHHHKSWTAEEWQKFMYPVADFVLLELLPENERHLVWLTSRIVEMLFNSRKGLDTAQLKMLKDICWRRCILLEEWVGQKECVITSHETQHIMDDILRFGHSDNYWCFHFERAVKRYKATKTNFKNIEYTYSKMEIRREVLLVQQRAGSSDTFKFDGKYMIASSVDGAKALFDELDMEDRTKVERSGILVGSLSVKKSKLITDDLANYCNDHDIEVVDWCRQMRSCFFPETSQHQQAIYRIGEKARVNHFGQEYVCEIVKIIYTKNKNDEPISILRLLVFNFVSEEGEFSYFRESQVEIMAPTDQLMRKVILIPHDDDLFTCLDYNRPFPEIPSVLTKVPHYPVIGDMVSVNLYLDDYIASVDNVSVIDKQCEVQIYAEIDGGCYEKFGDKTTCDWDDISKLVQGEHRNELFYIHQ